MKSKRASDFRYQRVVRATNIILDPRRWVAGQATIHGAGKVWEIGQHRWAGPSRKSLLAVVDGAQSDAANREATYQNERRGLPAS